MDKQAISALVLGHEGIRHAVYLDTEGIQTVGVGFNLERAGARQRIAACGVDYEQLCEGTATLTAAQAQQLFEDDLDNAITDARQIVRNFDDQPSEVQAVIVDMVFNLGAAGFRKFRMAIACLEDKDYQGAAKELKNSKWATQVPNRANDNIAQIKQFGEASSA
jgi:GH24 family phage-related lysozyme (muramidase)